MKIKYSQYLLLLLLLLLPFKSQARHGFAVVIDSKSLSEAREEVNAYIRAIEQRQGLKVYTVVDRWGIPDSIRATLKRMHEQKQDPIVGAVFIGDIPIPMVRDAQHLTSAFKMSQKADRRDSSVPSDRYYDDFGLQFTSLGRDSDAAYPYFYYSLSANGDQTLSPDIFSGRIRPTDTKGSTRYDKLRTYLRKATQFKLNPEHLNSVFIFNGNGSLTESNVAHIDEFRSMMEHFPQLQQRQESYSYMQHDEAPYIKTKMEQELMRPDLSLAILHHHGDYDTQYLGAYPRPRTASEAIDYIKYTYRNNIRTYKRFGKDPDSIKAKIIASSGIPAEWLADVGSAKSEAADSLIVTKENLTLHDFADGRYKPNCRYINFDACYNGAFNMEDCIANEYIFQPGKTLVAMAGSVNILQDKWPDRFMGLLARGIMAGYIAQCTSYLEWHLIGDPTFAFASEANSADVNAMMADYTPKDWLKAYDKVSDSDIKAMALYKLSSTRLMTSARLLNIQQTSPFAMVRLEAFLTLRLRGGDDFVKAIQIASRDNHELIQRFAVNEMQSNGDPRIISSLLRLYLKNNPSARVEFNASQALQFFPEQEMMPIARHLIDSLSAFAIDTTTFATKLSKIKEYSHYWDGDIADLISGKLDAKHALRQANYMRIYMPSYLIPDVAQYTATCTNAELQRDLLEALGWHGTAYTAGDIVKVAEQLSHDTSRPKEVRQEALKTLKRVNAVRQR